MAWRAHLEIYWTDCEAALGGAALSGITRTQGVVAAVAQNRRGAFSRSKLSSRKPGGLIPRLAGDHYESPGCPSAAALAASF